VAIVLDSPKGAYYGTAVSAPVFAEVAQQVLEYLGVPHDIELQPVKPPLQKEAPAKEDDASSESGDINALYAAVNDLPSDDPLRNPPPAPTQANTPAPALAAPVAAATSDPHSSAKPDNQSLTRTAQTAAPAAPSPSSSSNSVVISDAGQIRVPSLIGLTVRQVIEQAGTAGFEVDIVGNGIVREQAPAAGSMVHAGIKVVVRCER
jgi:cell division protein FtsI (penicillin-binding protein 3)